MVERLAGHLHGRAHRLVPAAIGLVALGFVAWFMISTAPRATPEKTATVGIRLVAPADTVSNLTVFADASLTTDGGASVDVNAYFLCSAAAEVAVHLTSQEASALDYAPVTTGEILDDPLADVMVTPQDDGLQVVGGCSELQPVDVRFEVDYPAGSVSVPLARGSYAFGLDLFAWSEADVLTRPSYAMVLQPPSGALLEDAFGSAERSFNHATWEADDELDLTAYGMYTVPREVSRALWWDNAILLILGAIVGIALEAVLSRTRRLKALATERSDLPTDSAPAAEDSPATESPPQNAVTVQPERKPQP